MANHIDSHAVPNGKLYTLHGVECVKWGANSLRHENGVVSCDITNTRQA